VSALKILLAPPRGQQRGALLADKCFRRHLRGSAVTLKKLWLFFGVKPCYSSPLRSKALFYSSKKRN
jgi:hypothetical protein